MKKLIFATILLMLASCTKDYHFNRFIKKGGQINPTIEWKTVTKSDTIQGKNGQDSIVYVTKQEPYAVYDIQYVPKWQVRFDNKRFEDSLKHIRKMYSDSLRNAVKSQRIESKTEIKTTKSKEKAGNRWSLVGVLFGLALVIIGIGVVFRRK